MRNGKAKKNDPPIPADLAPISGSGKRVRKEVPEEKGFLEPIKFRYSTEKIVEEPTETPAAEEAQPEAAENKPSRSRSRRRKPQNGAPKEPQPKAEAAPKQEKPKKEPKEPKPGKEAAPEAPAEEGQEKKPHRRRPNYRRRKPQKTGGDSSQ